MRCAVLATCPNQLTLIFLPHFPKTELRPFGIIAAVSKNGVIGVKGDLPWNVPADRRAFEDITRHKTLIIGRQTLLEGATRNLNHVAHCRQVVVVSRTLQEYELTDVIKSAADTAKRTLPSFRLACSVKEAIQTAQRNQPEPLPREAEMETSSPWLGLDCWIGGGEAIYADALTLEQAQYLHLTILNTHVRLPSDAAVAHFPNEMEWKPHYRLVSQKEHPAKDPISFFTNVYERIQPHAGTRRGER